MIKKVKKDGLLVLAVVSKVLFNVAIVWLLATFIFDGYMIVSNIGGIFRDNDSLPIVTAFMVKYIIAIFFIGVLYMCKRMTDSYGEEFYDKSHILLATGLTILALQMVTIVSVSHNLVLTLYYNTKYLSGGDMVKSLILGLLSLLLGPVLQIIIGIVYIIKSQLFSAKDQGLIVKEKPKEEAIENETIIEVEYYK